MSITESPIDFQPKDNPDIGFVTLTENDNVAVAPDPEFQATDSLHRIHSYDQSP